TGYALGISVVILDDSGWRVIQSLHTEHTDWIEEYISGINVQEVYIITSLMSADTPSEYGDIYHLDEIPSVALDYEIEEWHTPLGSNNNLTYIIPISGAAVLVICGIVILLRKRMSSTQILGQANRPPYRDDFQVIIGGI
ncbi:MAG: hypothetical protein ACW98Y_21510, partial [Candidatus Thorarchaeota archaeon]